MVRSKAAHVKGRRVRFADDRDGLVLGSDELKKLSGQPTFASPGASNHQQTSVLADGFVWVDVDPIPRVDRDFLVLANREPVVAL